PSYIDTPAPSAKISSATTKLQKYSSRPYPNGCAMSGGRAARRCPCSSSTSFPQSTSECTASLSMEALPLTVAATPFVTATSTFPMSAAYTAVREDGVFLEARVFTALWAHCVAGCRHLDPTD